MLKAPADRNGSPIAMGDAITFEQATEELLRDLPSQDKLAIKEQVGKTFVIAGFNPQGNPEIEFVDRAGVRHTIWVENFCVVKVAR